MSADTLVEQRIAHLERQSNWIEQLIGSQREEPDAEEVLRLGQEIRQATH